MSTIARYRLRKMSAEKLAREIEQLKATYAKTGNPVVKRELVLAQRLART